MDRLPSGLLVGAMLRRANDAGGSGMVLAKGDAQAGGILALVVEDGRERLFERGLGPDGAPALIESTPRDDVTGYWQRRRARDPDLWVIELIVAGAQRLVAETIAAS
ncbi:hypothetical protein GCM10011380_30090 [Sphingomonas metalli]|uniref:DUF1491 family protein n=1 Tax=Sphingomonas metalli TaxID=1779358 RepID=A0A916TB29_9SPHN|nr:DUF1491 family protein [Sphingomonas metalli]GGB38655.1 hypothetical protein GCM10011380_30090 [Sphingomonas metalli]